MEKRVPRARLCILSVFANFKCHETPVIQHNASTYREQASIALEESLVGQESIIENGDFFVNIHLYGFLAGSPFSTLATLRSSLSRIGRVLAKAEAALKNKICILDLADWLFDHALEAPKEVNLSKTPNQNWLYTSSKRLLDLVASLGGLFALAPLFFLTWLLILRQGDGPVLFAQERIEYRAGAFTCYKFRTMAVGTVQAGTHEVSGQAVTPLGARLRRWKIDELPQLWNVLKGEMSLIGPRPCLPSQEDLIQRRKDAGVLNVKPGISGLAQVAGIEMSDSARLVEWDALYIAIRSLVLDLKLIFMTVKGGGRGDRVAS